MTDDGIGLVARANLLPTSATPLERAIAEVDGRLDDIAVEIIRDVRAVSKVSAEILPYLAWERSVDVWDPEWPEDVRRAVVDAAPIVHRYKGTRRAIRAALEALQVDATIVEWWETAPVGAPYTFRIGARARARLYDGPILDDRLIRSIYASIMRAKPVSRAFTLTVGATFPRSLGVAGVAFGRVASRAVMHPVLAVRAKSTLGLAGVALGVTRVRSAFLLRSS